VNGSSPDPSTAAFEKAIGACKDLEPARFTGHISERVAAAVSPHPQRAASGVVTTKTRWGAIVLLRPFRATVAVARDAMMR
jgi:hypothetical protein